MAQRYVDASYLETLHQNSSYVHFPICEFLIGTPLDDLALCYLSTISRRIRVSDDGCITTDGCLGSRITVRVDKKGIIENIEFETSIGLPKGILNGSYMHRALQERLSAKQS